MQPWVGQPLFVANAAYNSGANGNWAEGALEMSENMLVKCFGLKRPG